MRVLWHSVAPWAKSGYGTQTATWVPRLAALGHEVAISAYHGLYGSPVDWHGITVYPAGVHPQGADVLPMHARHFKADVVITLFDFWTFGAAVAAARATPEVSVAALPLAAWLPLDTRPLSQGDKTTLAEIRPVCIAMSRFGEQNLKDGGYDPLYVPHGIDTSVFSPPEDRVWLRGLYGFGDRFVIMMNATNLEGSYLNRKGWTEQLQAFALLHGKHPDTLLLLNTMAKNPSGIDVEYLTEDLGIRKATVFTDQYLYASGQIEDEHLAAMYGAADLYSACSYGEGFCLPLVEAQACGTPAVATNFSAMTETCGGWLVEGSKHYIPGHRANWARPTAEGIAAVYEKAYQRGKAYTVKKNAARAHALRYDVEKVLTEYWMPALAELERRLGQPNVLPHARSGAAQPKLAAHASDGTAMGRTPAITGTACSQDGPSGLTHTMAGTGPASAPAEAKDRTARDATEASEHTANRATQAMGRTEVTQTAGRTKIAHPPGRP